jgi:hypothetical protein
MHSQEAERKFRDFSERLLKAQRYSFSGRDIFSRDSLKPILQEFCGIIAQNLGVQSCTIQLKLYDPADVPCRDEGGTPTSIEKVLKTSQTKRSLQEHCCELSKQWSHTPGLKKSADDKPEAPKDLVDRRRDVWFNSSSFPYAFWPKGAVKLVAANAGGPWYPFSDTLEFITPLEKGITADIVQDREAKLRDPLSIRATRGLRKLGTHDEQVWNAGGPLSLFYNYYAAPIRIHPAGEALGVLKVENKSHAPPCLFSVEDLARDKDQPRQADWTSEEPYRILRWRRDRPRRTARHIEKVLHRRLRRLALDEVRDPKSLVTALIRELNRLVHDKGMYRELTGRAAADQRDGAASRAHEVIRILLKNLAEPEPGTRSDLRTKERASTAYLFTHECSRTKGLEGEDSKCAGLHAAFDLWNNWFNIARLKKELLGHLGRLEQPAMQCRISFFSLAYLLLDIERQVGTSDFRLCDLLDIPYPYALSESRSGTLTLSKLHGLLSKRQSRKRQSDYAKLRPDRPETRPPIQLLFEDLEQEQAFLEIFYDESTKGGDTARVDSVSAFLSELEKRSHDLISQARSGSVVEKLEEALEDRIKALAPNREVGIERLKNNTPCHRFCYGFRIKIHSPQLREIKLHVVLFPTGGELTHNGRRPLASTPDFWWGRDGKDGKAREEWKAFRFLNAFYCHSARNPPDLKSGLGFRGELADLTHPKGTESSLSLPHLITDRLAARRQAFAFSLPMTFFNVEDALKLSWAALEIGKLIERQIAYRGNHSRPHIPLTAMEFYRLPISSLGFVDDLRRQHGDAQRVENHLQYQLKNEMAHLGFERSVVATPRIKEFRSYFERLGERFMALEVSELAVWLHVLSVMRLEVQENAKAQEFASKIRGFKAALNGLKRLAGSRVEMRAGWLTNEQEWSAILFDPRRRPQDSLLGDLCFESPWLRVEDAPKGMTRRQTLGHCVIQLLKNLEAEGLAVPNDDDLQGRSRKAEQLLTDLVFRNYDPFVRSSVSLLIQLLNRRRLAAREEEIRGLYEFYRAMRRGFSDTESPLVQSEDFERFRKQAESLREFMLRTETKDFQRDVLKPAAEENWLCISPAGAYKRARMLLNVFRTQRPPALLNWELGRFDYVGARLDCLFKNQVFAAYESIWSRGDPFFQFRRGGEETKEPDTQAIEDRFTEKRRQRFYCLRTSVHSDGVYNAWQIAALMDPNAILPGHWGSRSYTLSRLRYLMGAMFWSLCPKAAKSYVHLGDMRLHCMRSYRELFKRVNNLLTERDIGDPPSSAKPSTSPSMLAGTAIRAFAAEDGIDRLIDFIRDTVESREDVVDRQKTLAKLVTPARGTPWSVLTKFLRASRDYSSAYSKWIQEPEAGKPRLATVRQASRVLEERILRLLPRIQNHGTPSRKARRDTGSGASSADHGAGQSDWPHVFLTQAKHNQLERWALRLQNRAQSRRGRTDAGLAQDMAASWLKDLGDLLILFERSQNEFLFPRGGRRDAGNALSIDDERGQEAVLDRLLNYTLLFNWEVLSKNSWLLEGLESRIWNPRDRKLFLGWTAYDLFYYVRSLIPVELQVRTQLANTMAEQYHNAVYKATPPKGTERERKRMGDIGRQLDELDKEMEVLIEEYVEHWEEDLKRATSSN